MTMNMFFFVCGGNAGEHFKILNGKFTIWIKRASNIQNSEGHIVTMHYSYDITYSNPLYECRIKRKTTTKSFRCTLKDLVSSFYCCFSAFHCLDTFYYLVPFFTSFVWNVIQLINLFVHIQ